MTSYVYTYIYTHTYVALWEGVFLHAYKLNYVDAMEYTQK